MRALIVPLLLLLAASAPAPGVTVGGRLTSSLYAYEGQETQTHLRAHQALSLTLGQLLLPEVSLHTYLRGTTDLGDQAESDPSLQVRNAFLAWNGPSYRAFLGRQRILAGVAYGAIDGFRGDLEAYGLDLSFFAGPLVPVGGAAEIGSWSDGNLWGLRLGTDRLFGTAVALSFAHRERDPERYRSAGRFSGTQLDPPEVVQRLVGVDLGRQFAGGHSVYGRLDYDFGDEEVRRVELSGRYTVTPRLAGQLEWFRRTPWVFENSLFNAFPNESYQEVGGRLSYAATPEVQLTAHFANLLYDNDSAQRMGLTASIGPRYTIGYFRTSGYAHASDGLTGSVSYPLSRILLLQGEVDLTAYERFVEEDRDDLVTGSVGLRYQPRRSMHVDLQLQGLRNPLFSSDMRLFVRASWRFFNAVGRGER